MSPLRFSIWPLLLAMGACQSAPARPAIAIICHRGCSQFAHENTLDAYRATFELGADGNEIDIRSTRDGVLVCFHDGTIEMQLKGFGEIADYSLQELRQMRPREQAFRIPTLAEVLELHRKYGGILHLDVKQAGIDREVGAMLDRTNMWDHIAHCNDYNADVILHDRRYRPRQYKGELYESHGEVDPLRIAALLSKPGDDVIVDDPRGVLLALGRKIGEITRAVRPSPQPLPVAQTMSIPDLLQVINDADDWNRITESPADQAESARRITARARAADLLADARVATDEVLRALEDRIRHRSLHKDCRYHGLDGEMALRSLILLDPHRGVEMARFILWRNDPDLEKVADPTFNMPAAWADWRIKQVIFPALELRPGQTAQELCRDYLTLSEEDARKLGPPLFDSAAKALITISPTVVTATALLRHPLQVVRGRAILECLSHASEPWATNALRQGAPRALRYLPQNDLPER